jgi:putative membrane protein
MINKIKKTKKRKIRLFFTGLFMGSADLVPGVSGGTVAFLLGIYDELLYTVKLVTGEIPKLMLSGKFKQAFMLIPFGFLIPLGIGLASAIFGLVYLVSFLLDTQPTLVWSLFFGLVLGSAYVVSKRVKQWNVGRASLLILGFVLTYAIVGMSSIGSNSSPLAIFATGVIAITAMILPGISGSLIMVLLGQYEIIIKAVANREIFIMIIFATGAIVGLAIFVRVLTWLLKHCHMAVIAFLVGVMAGSLRRIWPWQDVDLSGSVINAVPAIDFSLVVTLTLALVGFVAVVVLERVGIAREHDDIDTSEFKKEFKDIEYK